MRDLDDYPMSNADVMRDQHTEAILLGLGCPFDCAACDTQEQYADEDAWQREEQERKEAEAHAKFRTHIETFRAEAIATSETVTVVWP